MHSQSCSIRSTYAILPLEVYLFQLQSTLAGRLDLVLRLREAEYGDVELVTAGKGTIKVVSNEYKGR